MSCAAGRALKHCSPELKADRELVTAAVAQVSGAASPFCPSFKHHVASRHPRLHQGSGRVFFSFQSPPPLAPHPFSPPLPLTPSPPPPRQDGDALRHASKRLQGDRTVVLSAVAQNGLNLAFASRALRKDRAVVRTAEER